MKIVKILPNKRIKNRLLRLRADISPFEKTAVHMYSEEACDNFDEWLKLLTPNELIKVREMFQMPLSDCRKKYPHLKWKELETDAIYLDLLDMIRKERTKHCGIEYHIEEAIIKRLKMSYNITKKK